MLSKFSWSAEQVQFDLIQEKIEGCILSNSNDRWSWSLDGVGDFTVASVKKVIDDHILPTGNTNTRWVKEVHIKINIHAWKVKNDGFPTRFNMSRRGMEFDSILCPPCVIVQLSLLDTCSSLVNSFVILCIRSSDGGSWITGRLIHI